MSTYAIANSYVPLDNLTINIGQALSNCDNQLIVPRSGIYFLSWSSASAPNSIHDLQLHINNISVGRTFLYGGYYNGIDTTSHTLLLFLKTGDSLQLYLKHEGPVYSDNNYQLSFTGFLYEPTHGQNVAWTLSFLFGEWIFIYGPSIVNFTNILLDSGSVWNSQSAAVNIPTDGTYYLSISGGAYPTENKFNLILSVNSQQLINVMEKVSTARNNTWNLRSRLLITPLRQGDQLVISIPNGYEAASRENDLTFSGFLVHI